MSWKKKDENIWHPFGPLKGQSNLLIEYGKGAYLHTEDGREILDGISSWWVNIHGHANPVVAKAIADQALKIEQVIFAGFTHRPAMDICEKLLTVLPDNQSKLFFSDDGSTAIEVALKLAIQYWHNKEEKRHKIIAIEGAYHGDTFGAMSIAERNMFSAPFDDKLFEVHFIPFPEGDGTNTIEAFTEVCDFETAGFIFEPLVQGAGGMRIYDIEVLNELMNIAEKHEVITIADEVMTGFYRTGEFFATDYLDHKPDLFCMSKALTAGFMAMSITSASKRIVAEFDNDQLQKTFWHGHSYTANPLACAAANASFDLLIGDQCQKQIQMIKTTHQGFVNKLKIHPKVAEAKSLGTILSLEVDVKDGGYTSSIRNRMYQFFLERNVLLRPLGNVVYILPPYVITEDELKEVYELILEFLDSEN